MVIYIILLLYVQAVAQAQRHGGPIETTQKCELIETYGENNPSAMAWFLIGPLVGTGVSNITF